LRVELANADKSDLIQVQTQVSKKILFLPDKAAQDPTLSLSQKLSDVVQVPEVLESIKLSKGAFSDEDLSKLLESRFTEGSTKPFRTIQLLLAQSMHLWFTCIYTLSLMFFFFLLQDSVLFLTMLKNNKIDVSLVIEGIHKV